MASGKSLPILVLLILALVSAGRAQTPVIPTQAINSKNQEVTSSSNSSVSVTLTAPSNTRARLYGVTARCSAGSSSLTVRDGGTQRWSSDPAFVGTVSRAILWSPPFTGAIGSSVVVTLESCGVGNVGTLAVQGDVF